MDEDDIFDEKKNWFRRHWIISILLGIFVIGLIGMISDNANSGVTGNVVQDTESKSEETIYKLGEEINLGSTTYKVTDVFTLPLLGNGYFNEEAKGTFVIVSIEIENVGKEEIFLSSTNFKLLDSQERTYDADISGAVYAESSGLNGFVADSIGAGLKTSGDIIFDVPENDIGLVLELKAPGLMGNKAKVDIGDVADL